MECCCCCCLSIRSYTLYFFSFVQFHLSCTKFHRFCYLQRYFVAFSLATYHALCLCGVFEWMSVVRVSRDISYLGNLKQNQYFMLFTYFYPCIQQTFYLSIEFHSLSPHTIYSGSFFSLSFLSSHNACLSLWRHYFDSFFFSTIISSISCALKYAERQTPNTNNYKNAFIHS